MGVGEFVFLILMGFFLFMVFLVIGLIIVFVLFLNERVIGKGVVFGKDIFLFFVLVLVFG